MSKKDQKDKKKQFVFQFIVFSVYFRKNVFIGNFLIKMLH